MAKDRILAFFKRNAVAVYNCFGAVASVISLCQSVAAFFTVSSVKLPPRVMLSGQVFTLLSFAFRAFDEAVQARAKESAGRGPDKMLGLFRKGFWAVCAVTLFAFLGSGADPGTHNSYWYLPLAASALACFWYQLLRVIYAVDNKLKDNRFAEENVSEPGGLK